MEYDSKKALLQTAEMYRRKTEFIDFIRDKKKFLFLLKSKGFGYIFSICIG